MSFRRHGTLAVAALHRYCALCADVAAFPDLSEQTGLLYCTHCMDFFRHAVEQFDGWVAGNADNLDMVFALLDVLDRGPCRH